MSQYLYRAFYNCCQIFQKQTRNIVSSILCTKTNRILCLVNIFQKVNNNITFPYHRTERQRGKMIATRLTFAGLGHDSINSICHAEWRNFAARKKEWFDDRTLNGLPIDRFERDARTRVGEAPEPLRTESLGSYSSMRPPDVTICFAWKLGRYRA